MEYYKIIEFHDEYWNKKARKEEETPVWKTKIERGFKYKEDCLNHFFSPRKRRDFCCGDNYVHGEDKDGNKILEIYEKDEGGVSTYVLYKWEGFDDEIVFRYTVKIAGEKNIMDYKELYSWLEKNKYIVYLDDDTYGHYGLICEIKDLENGIGYGDIVGNIECEYNTTPVHGV